MKQAEEENYTSPKYTLSRCFNGISGISRYSDIASSRGPNLPFTIGSRKSIQIALTGVQLGGSGTGCYGTAPNTIGGHPVAARNCQLW